MARSSTPAPRVAVGAIIKPHGVRGEVSVREDSDNPDRFVPGARFRTDHERFPLLIARTVRPGPNGLIIDFAGISSPETASEISGQILFIDATQRRPLEHDEYWPDDLVGLEARIEDRVVGRVADVILGPQDRLVIADDAGVLGEIPLVEALVPTVDVVGGWIILDPPDGLLTRR